MFGYVRPLKPELLVREFSRYQSIYCGICKQIGRDYGQVPRVALGYDLTLLAVLLLALAEEQPPEETGGCILKPGVRRTMVRGGPIIELCAGLTILMAWHKAADDAADERPLRGRLTQAALYRAWRRANQRFPGYETILAEELAALNQIEQGEPDPSAGELFGRLLERVFLLAAGLATGDQAIQAGIGRFGRHLGIWIYLLDAIDDWAADCNNGNWNPYARMDQAAARSAADLALREQELAMDRTAALFPYQRDSGLLANIVLQGLPAVRMQIMEGRELQRL
ncbi:MAG TPA: hypothetical protein DD640_02300 [Clostridiales bacterium]|nr:hypothetical protein [Clostridiales bacterium]